MAAIQAGSGINELLLSENIRINAKHSNAKKRSTTDDPTADELQCKRFKASSTEPDEIFGVLNFVYLSPKAKFFSVNSRSILEFRSSYPSTYGKAPSDADYCWIEPRRCDWAAKEGKLFGTPVICEVSPWRELIVCVELQGQPGIPKIIGYENRTIKPLLVHKKYSKDLPSSLTVHQMAEQLLQALHNIHKQGLTHANLNYNRVRWDDDKIILINWMFVQLRGDCSERYEYNYDRAQPFNDLAAAGEVIREWAKQRNCIGEFESLIDGLTNPNAFQRLTAMQALNILQGRAVLKPDYIDSESLFQQLSYQQVCSRFIDQFNAELTTTQSTEESCLEECQWHTEAATDQSTTLKFGTRNGAQVFAKIKQGPVKSIAWEYFVTKMMSGKSKHFPTVITSHARSTEAQEVAEFTIIMPEYHTEPKVKNLRKTFQELLSALKALRYHGLVHGDIAPQNIMWDDNDELILIDFGSSFMVNHECVGPGPMYGGHHGFMAPERIPTLASDVYSFGRVMLHYMVQWKQEDSDLLQLVRKMVQKLKTLKQLPHAPEDMQGATTKELLDLTVPTPHILDNLSSFTHSTGWKSVTMRSVQEKLFAYTNDLDMESLCTPLVNEPIPNFKIPVRVAEEFRSLLENETDAVISTFEAWVVDEEEEAQLPPSHIAFWWAALHAVMTTNTMSYYTAPREADYTGNVFHPLFATIAACFPSNLGVKYRYLSWEPKENDLQCWKDIENDMKANLPVKSLRADAALSFTFNNAEYVFATFEAKRCAEDSIESPNFQSSVYAALAMRDTRRRCLALPGLCFSSAGPGINLALMRNGAAKYERKWSAYDLLKASQALEFFYTLAHLPAYLQRVLERYKPTSMDLT